MAYSMQKALQKAKRLAKSVKGKLSSRKKKSKVSKKELNSNHGQSDARSRPDKPGSRTAKLRALFKTTNASKEELKSNDENSAPVVLMENDALIANDGAPELKVSPTTKLIVNDEIEEEKKASEASSDSDTNANDGHSKRSGGGRARKRRGGKRKPRAGTDGRNSDDFPTSSENDNAARDSDKEEQLGGRAESDGDGYEGTGLSKRGSRVGIMFIGNSQANECDDDSSVSKPMYQLPQLKLPPRMEYPLRGSESYASSISISDISSEMIEEVIEMSSAEMVEEVISEKGVQEYIDSLEKAREYLNEVVNSKDKELEQLTAKVNEINQNRLALELKLSEASQYSDSMEAQLKSMRLQVESSKTDVIAKEAVVKEKNEEIAILFQHVERLTEGQRTLESELSEVRQIAAANERDQHKRFKELSEELEESQKKLQTEQQKSDTLLKRAEKRHSDANFIANGLSKELSLTKAELNRVKKEFKEFRKSNQRQLEEATRRETPNIQNSPSKTVKVP